jgi:mitochondrial fission protein ELM1
LDCWVVTDGRAGNENQALGLAEAVGRRFPLSITVKRLAIKKSFPAYGLFSFGDPFRALSTDGALLRPPFPDLVIGCGRISVAYSSAIRRRSTHTYVVQIQNPRTRLDSFDLVIPPLHDRVEGRNVVSIVGAPHRMTVEKLRADSARLQADPRIDALARPYVAVLLGGPNRAYAFDQQTERRLAAALHGLADVGCGLLITPSRRTPSATRQTVKHALANAPHFFWDGGPVGGIDNPYAGMLGLADYILVTEDSVNMATEAALTGKPIHFLELGRKAMGDPSKFERFRRALIEHGAARRFDGTLENWSYAALDETSRVAEEIARRLKPSA